MKRCLGSKTRQLTLSTAIIMTHMKIVNVGSCPLKGKKPQKQQLKVLSQQAEAGCVCNGVLDYRGNGQCRSIFHGRRWCYVQWNSKCQDKRRIEGVLWSWEACER